MKIAKLIAEATAKPWVIKENATNGKEEAWCHWHEVGPLSLMGRYAQPDDLLIASLANSAEALVELVKAADQCLDDMGETGHCVCPAAKEWLRAALAALPEDWRDE